MSFWRAHESTSLLLTIFLIAVLSSFPIQAASDFDSLVAEIRAGNSVESATIELQEDIRLSAPLPAVTGHITVEGGGHSISGDDRFRIFDVGGGRLTLNNITLQQGSSELGGAILLRNGAKLSLLDTTLRQNRASRGGAIAMSSGNDQLSVRRSSLEVNIADDYGGAIYIEGGSAAIDGGSFVNNRTEIAGGAIYSINGSAKIANSTFSHNVAGAGGGALDIIGGDIALTHLTFEGNSSRSGDGNAIFSANARVILRNSIIAGPSGSEDCSGGFAQNVGNLSLDGTCADLPSATVLLGKITGATGWYPLLDGSPAVDAAIVDFCPESDQIGTPRPQGGGCDVGAIESTTARPALPTAEPTVCTLANRILSANSDRSIGGCPAGTSHDVITLTEDIVLEAHLPRIVGTITINGGGHTISGDNRYRIFDVDGGSLTINNLTLVRGAAVMGDGGAIRLQNGASATVNDSRFHQNWAADSGGAISAGLVATRLNISNSDFRGNLAKSFGGALFLNDSTTRIEKSSFVENEARLYGGAIHNLQARLDASNSTFVGNFAHRGGALNAGGWSANNLTHLTMKHNWADEGSALRTGAGRDINGDGRAIKLRNSVIVGIRREQCAGRLSQNHSNLISDGTCSPKFSGDAMLGEMTGSPAWLPLADDSPAIDAAHPAYCLPTDQLGNPRPQGGGCDIGAIESLTGRATNQELTECRVTTTHGLNFRDSPNGEVIGGVRQGVTLYAESRTPGWFQVDNQGVSGWISADYVTTAGNCG